MRKYLFCLYIFCFVRLQMAPPLLFLLVYKISLFLAHWMCSYSVLQSCPTLPDLVDWSPLGSSVHGISQGKNIGVGCHFLLRYWWQNWTIKKAECLKNWCFWIVVLEKTLGSPLDSKIKPVNPKGTQTSILIGRTDAEAEVPVLWPPGVNSQVIGKDPDAGKDCR